MTDDIRPKKNTVFTEEMANAARTRLKGWFAKQEAEREAAPEIASTAKHDVANTDDGVESDDYDDGQKNEDAHDLFPFAAGEQLLIERLDRAIRQRTQHAEPLVLQKVAAVLHALQRLPYSTPGIAVDLAMVDRINEDMSYVSLEIDESSFRLSRGGSAFTPGVGSDSYSETELEIELGGFRDGETEDFEEWLDAFVSTGGELRVEGEADVDVTDQAPADGWDRLSDYWDSQ